VFDTVGVITKAAAGVFGAATWASSICRISVPSIYTARVFGRWR